MRISDWSSDVCTSDLGLYPLHATNASHSHPCIGFDWLIASRWHVGWNTNQSCHRPLAKLLCYRSPCCGLRGFHRRQRPDCGGVFGNQHEKPELGPSRSEEHTSELQSLMRISYAVFCLKKKKYKTSS